MITRRGEGSVTLFLAVNEMNGQHDSMVAPAASRGCHPEPHSERSIALGVEMLRRAQHDRADLLPRHRPLSTFRLLSPFLAIPATPLSTHPHSM